MRRSYDIKDNGHTVYILISKLPVDEQEAFKNWLYRNGQTQPLIDGEEEYDCAYPWDYVLWKDNNLNFADRQSNLI